MIDIHSHLLPGVDDGSPSIEASVRVLERFGAEGVARVVLTPHLDASQAHHAPYVRYHEIFADLCAAAPALPELCMGWEIMLDEPHADLRSPFLSLDASKAVLIEFARMAVPPAAEQELRRLSESGVTPVLAHPERYWGCTVALVRRWRSAGAVIQMDTAGLIGRGEIATMSRALLEEGLVDLFASDNHGDTRSLATARDWLLECATPEHAALLTEQNAARVLADQPLLAVPPLPRETGMFARLREMFLKM